MAQTLSWKEIEQQVIALAATIFGKYESEALSDFTEFKRATEVDLQAWVRAYMQKEISTDELKELVLGQKDLLKLHALKQKGLSKIALDEFTSGVFNIITQAITKLIPI